MTTLTESRRATRNGATPYRAAVRRRHRWWALGLVGMLVAMGLAAVALDRPAPPASPRVDRAELERYEQAVAPVVRRGGSVVEQGMKPALGDLATRHTTPPAVIAHEAEGWIRDLGAVRRELAAITPPPGLARVAETLDAALAAYITAAAEFRAAALADGAERERLLDSGVRSAESADDTYDDASALLQAARRELGLPPSPDFPDPGHDS